MTMSLLQQVFRQADVPDSVTSYVTNALYESDTPGWDDTQLARKLLWWRDRAIDTRVRAARRMERELARLKFDAAMMAEAQAHMKLAMRQHSRPTPPNPVGLPDVLPVPRDTHPDQAVLPWCEPEVTDPQK
jgi:hypothetical protein